MKDDAVSLAAGESRTQRPELDTHVGLRGSVCLRGGGNGGKGMFSKSTVTLSVLVQNWFNKG